MVRTWPAWHTSPNLCSLSEMQTKGPCGPLSAHWQGSPKGRVTLLHLSEFKKFTNWSLSGGEGEGKLMTMTR